MKAFSLHFQKLRSKGDRKSKGTKRENKGRENESGYCMLRPQGRGNQQRQRDSGRHGARPSVIMKTTIQQLWEKNKISIGK